MSVALRLSGGWNWVVAAVLVILFGLPVEKASGQAVPTASKSIGFSVYGAASEIDPDYGAPTNYGFLLGGAVSRHTRFIDVTIEPRFGDTWGQTVGQRYFLGILKFERAVGPHDRIHPYAGAGIGYGIFKYELAGFSDNSTVYAIDFGADVDVHGDLGVKVDWQYQFWDLGYETNGFTPHGFAVGLVYRVNSVPFLHRH
jgi:opacity protein-like surface antigen